MENWEPKGAFHIPTTPTAAAVIESVDDASFWG
jgi:hypothetical protein